MREINRRMVTVGYKSALTLARPLGKDMTFLTSFAGARLTTGVQAQRGFSRRDEKPQPTIPGRYNPKLIRSCPELAQRALMGLWMFLFNRVPLEAPCRVALPVALRNPIKPSEICCICCADVGS